ncbi:hypothetical protein AWZ03_014667 [Drosophila navojoa]|uniref:Reverse transcriptase domain-containing protein n=1 Tax=Drosophila navojoa TaxID=7232 RepID=A0A484ATH1_DRONA|nr:hypothetical protein AWZ03_014667 [Drosophila navojoa]
MVDEFRSNSAAAAAEQKGHPPEANMTESEVPGEFRSSPAARDARAAEEEEEDAVFPGRRRAPIVLLKKKTGVWHMCVDYRQLNANSIPNAYPVPRINHILEKLRHAHYISTLDLKSGYWQIPMAADSRECTAFTVPGRGLFQWRVMPFGSTFGGRYASESVGHSHETGYEASRCRISGRHRGDRRHEGAACSIMWRRMDSYTVIGVIGRTKKIIIPGSCVSPPIRGADCCRTAMTSHGGTPGREEDSNETGAEILLARDVSGCGQIREALRAVKLQFTAPYSPHENPTGRPNRTVKSMIAQSIDGHQSSWDELLPEISLAINSSVADSTGFTPAFLMMGREPRLPSALYDEVTPGSATREVDPSTTEERSLRSGPQQFAEGVGGPARVGSIKLI